jgi:type II secretory pathway pseudopilin PulG
MEVAVAVIVVCFVVYVLLDLYSYFSNRAEEERRRRQAQELINEAKLRLEEAERNTREVLDLYNKK